VLGSIDLIKYCQKYGIKITPHVESIIATYDSKGEIQGKRKSWLTFLTEQGHDRNYDRKQLCPIPSIESIDLLDQLLVYDQDKRLTAREALIHPFFHQVRERAQSEVRMLQMSCTDNI
jgi:casein kinase II subunit alpha